MTCVVHTSPRAEADLDEIADFVANASQSSSAATRLLDRIWDRALMLARYPQAGEAQPELGPGIRAFPSGSYVIYYRPTPDGIELIRVLHGARDRSAIFGESEG